MKAEIVEKQKPEEFEPIEIKITIENRDELEFLFAVSNAHEERLSEFLKELTCHSFDSDNVSTWRLYDILKYLV